MKYASASKVSVELSIKLDLNHDLLFVVFVLRFLKEKQKYFFETFPSVYTKLGEVA